MRTCRWDSIAPRIAAPATVSPSSRGVPVNHVLVTAASTVSLFMPAGVPRRRLIWWIGRGSPSLRGVDRVVYSCNETVDGTEVPGGFETVARPPDEWLDPDPPLPAPQEPFTALVLRWEKHG
jgi:hypothetical protein